MQEGAHGFSADAARIGREMKSLPDTVAVTNRKLVERLAMGADTDEAAAAARKAKALPLAARSDPYKHHEAALPAATVLPPPWHRAWTPPPAWPRPRPRCSPTLKPPRP